MKLTNMPEGKPLGWIFTDFNGIATISNEDGSRISGKIISIDDVRYAKLSSKFGDLTLGYNGVYGQWAFEEAGGSVVVFYSENPKNGMLYLAGGYEKRLLINDGSVMFGPPGGFGINSESSEDTAKT